MQTACKSKNIMPFWHFGEVLATDIRFMWVCMSHVCLSEEDSDSDARQQRKLKYESTHMTQMSYIADLMVCCQIDSERWDNAVGQQSSASWRHTFHFKIIIKTNHWKNNGCFFLCLRACFLFRPTDFILKVMLRHHYLLYFFNVFYVKIVLF